MRFAALTPGGAELPLPPALWTKLDFDEEAPAHGFAAAFPLMPGPVPTLSGVRAYDEAGLCFDGIIDEQCRGRGVVGATLTLKARSREALLLDNEAVPSVCRRPNLPQLAAEHLAPYGFNDVRGSDEIFTASMPINKGMSEWAVLEAFCRAYLGGGLRARGGVLYAGVQPPRGRVCFGRERPYASIAVVNDNYRAYSELRVCQPGFSGYGTLIKDDRAAALGVRRRRCVNEGWAGQAQAMIENADKKAFRIELTCPGGVCANILDHAEVDDPALGRFTGLFVRRMAYRLSPSGETCAYTLGREDTGRR